MYQVRDHPWDFFIDEQRYGSIVFGEWGGPGTYGRLGH